MGGGRVGGLWYMGESKDSISDRRRKPFGQFDKHVKVLESFLEAGERADRIHCLGEEELTHRVLKSAVG